VSFWSTGITLDAELNRDRLEAYGWGDVGGEQAAIGVCEPEADSRRDEWDHIGSGSNGQEGCVESVGDEQPRRVSQSLAGRTQNIDG
jgi:hypothetical protein